MQADAVDAHPALIGPIDMNAKRAKYIHGRDRVFAFQEAPDFGHAFGQRTQHDRAVRYRFVAGNAHIADEPSARGNDVMRRHDVAHGIDSADPV